MNTYLLNLPAAISTAIILGSTLVIEPTHAQTAPPPNFGDETKGTPAVEESAPQAEASAIQSPGSGEQLTPEAEVDKSANNVFGNTKVVELRRENGQVYSIELQHSNAPTQYIEETDSDGNIEFESNDIEETPNLPKWKLGSW